MFKYLILLFNLIILSFINIVDNDNIKITPSFPSTVKAGGNFIMEFTINRNQAEGFSKFEQNLPIGFIAEPRESHDAIFTFKDQMVKLIWAALPSNEKFKISYKIFVAEDVVGEQSFGGTFSYVVDNVKLTVDIPEYKIKVIPSGKMAMTVRSESDSVNNKTSLTSIDTSTQTIIDSSSVYCTRKIFPVNGTSEFLVEITVHKGSIGGFGKLQENIPSGFSATVIKANNASFTFSEQKAKFVWIALPTEEFFTLSYTIKAVETSGEGAFVDGTFSYIENDETKKFTIASTPFTITNVPEQVTKTEALIDTGKAAGKENKDFVKENTSPINTIPAPEANVVYKVQIAAVHKIVSTSYFKKKHSITDPVNTEMHEGWTKYTTGSFNEYKSARNSREEIRTKNIQGPFVTAYNSGKRITVQEALMITSQQWYK